MKKLVFSYEVHLKFNRDIKNHYFMLRCCPPNTDRQKIYSMSFRLLPRTPVNTAIDGFGNLVYTGSILEKHREFIYSSTGIAFIEGKNIKEEPLHPVYKYPSPYTAFGKALDAFHQKRMPLEGENLQRAVFLMEELFKHFEYAKNTTTVSTTAEEALTVGSGVCQDYSHILLALCRKNGIPARYVAGLLLGEGETHSWIEIYSGGKWLGLDPTHNCAVDNNYIKLSCGRDFGDCVVDKGLFNGYTEQQQDIFVKVTEQ